VQLLPETLFLTTNLIDRFLAKQHVTRKNLQLVCPPNSSKRMQQEYCAPPPPLSRSPAISGGGNRCVSNSGE